PRAPFYMLRACAIHHKPAAVIPAQPWHRPSAPLREHELPRSRLQSYGAEIVTTMPKHQPGRSPPRTIDSKCESPYGTDMATLTLELPPRTTQRAFNLRRWAELLADRDLVRIEGRIETDRHGHIIVSPPPATEAIS